MPKRKRSIVRYVKRKISHKLKSFPISIVMPVVASAVTPPKAGWDSLVGAIQKGNIADGIKCFTKGWTGIDTETGQWEMGIPPFVKNLIVGALVHKGMNILGVNKQMARLPAPLNKISI